MPFDFHFGPFFRLHICIGFVNPRPFSAQLVPIESWRSDVLHRVVPHGLIFRMGIPRPKVKQFVVRCVRPGPEGDPNKAGHAYARRRSDLHGDIGLDRSVLNLDSLEKGEDVFLRLCGQTNRLASLVFDCLCLPAGHDQAVQIGQGQAPRRLCGWLRGAKDLCVRGKERRDGNQYGSRGMP